MSKANPMELFLVGLARPKLQYSSMAVSFLGRLPVVGSDINSDVPESVALAARQLVQSHLVHLNKVYNVSNPFELLCRTFYYDARPYDQMAHTPVGNRAIDYAKSQQARIRSESFEVLYGIPNLAIRLGEVRKDVDRFWTLRAKPQREILAERKTAQDLTDDHFAPSPRKKKAST